MFVFCDRSSRQHAIDTYGIQWMIEIRELRPASALADDAFLSYYVKQKEVAQAPNSGMAGPLAHGTTLPAASLPAATANADTRLPASAHTPVSA